MPSGVYVRTEENTRQCKEFNTMRLKGKTWEQVYGKDKAKRMKEVKAQVGKEWIDEKNPHWKGDDGGCESMHNYIHRRYGKANHCINPTCSNKSKSFHWSKIDHNTPYTRNVKDYQQLCRVCHSGYDGCKMMINGRYGW